MLEAEADPDSEGQFFKIGSGSRKNRWLIFENLKIKIKYPKNPRHFKLLIQYSRIQGVHAIDTQIDAYFFTYKNTSQYYQIFLKIS